MFFCEEKVSIAPSDNSLLTIMIDHYVIPTLLVDRFWNGRMIAFQQLGDLYEDFTRLIVIYIFFHEGLEDLFWYWLEATKQRDGKQS